MNIAEAFAAQARRRPGHATVEDGKRIVSYGELETLVNGAAANLRAEGIAPGDIVGLALPNSIEHVALLWALASIGAIFFPVNTSLLRSAGEVGLGTRQLKGVIVLESAPALPSGTNPMLLERIFAKTPDAGRAFVAPGGSNPLCCVQSSGTTGTPKTFVRSHDQMIASFHDGAPSLRWTNEDRYLALIRLRFSASCRNCLAALFAGATFLINRTENAEEIVSRVQQQRVTVTTLTPIHLRLLLDYAAGKPPVIPLIRSLRVVAAAITARELMLARRHLTPNVFVVYGANELSWISVAAPADQDAYPGTVGRPVPGVEAEIVDQDHQPLPCGNAGLLRLHSDCAATGYLNDAEADARAFRDGWFYPMDLAVINEAGYIFLKGRADDIISCDGIKFYPIEVEQVLLSHPDVREAAVFGWPHLRHGQVAVAAITTGGAGTGEKPTDFCRRHLAPFMVPQLVMRVAEMPRTPNGKILKRELKQMLRRQLAAHGRKS